MKSSPRVFNATFAKRLVQSTVVPYPWHHMIPPNEMLHIGDRPSCLAISGIAIWSILGNIGQIFSACMIPVMSERGKRLLKSRASILPKARCVQPVRWAAPGRVRRRIPHLARVTCLVRVFFDIEHTRLPSPHSLPNKLKQIRYQPRRVLSR